MRVLLLGSGAQGAVVAWHLGRSEAIDEVVCSDVSRARADTARRFAGSRKTRAIAIDATKPEALHRALRSVDMVVNAAHPRFNLSVARMALQSGIHYQDLAADYPTISAQLALSKGYARKGRFGLMHCGGSPGVTNVLAREGVEALDSVRAIKLRLVSEQESTRPVSLWSVEVALDDMEEAPVVFRDGRLLHVPPFSEEEIFEFPPPFGAQPVLQHMHEEPITFGRFLGKGLAHVDLKMGGHHVYQMKEAMSLGLLGRKPVRVGRYRIMPRDLLIALSPPAATPADVPRLLKAGVLIDAIGCHTVQVEGTKAGARRVIRFDSLGPSLRDVQEWIPGATNMSYKVGVAAAILVEMAAREEIVPHGMYPLECLGDDARALYLEKLQRAHIVIARRDVAI